ncbi:MAG: hypothetical protein V7675_17335 [Hyphomonas sp.]|uniref:hypothetical protein n=1 Tax=Hyphomonas sp. TaxID=87 RepID=UPI00300153D8
MEKALTCTSPILDERAPRAFSDVSLCNTKAIDSRTYEFFCVWLGEPFVLQELISARVDWGPFEIYCERTDGARTGHCRCEVRYHGLMREKQYLMTSFWGLMETFPLFE